MKILKFLKKVSQLSLQDHEKYLMIKNKYKLEICQNKRIIGVVEKNQRTSFKRTK